MKKIVFAVLVMVLPYSASLYFSWHWQSHVTARADDAPTDTGAATVEQGPVHLSHSSTLSYSSQKDPRNPVDETAELANSLRAQLAAVQEKEKRLAAREKQLDLIYHDIRSERARMEQLWKQIEFNLHRDEREKSSTESPKQPPVKRD
jgi:hypothetical protein